MTEQKLPEYVIDAIDAALTARAMLQAALLNIKLDYAALHTSMTEASQALEAAIKQYGDDRVGLQLSAMRVMKDQMR